MATPAQSITSLSFPAGSRGLLLLICALVIGIGLGFTVLLGRAVHDSEEHQLRERFAQVANERISRVEERLNGQLKELDALQRFVANSPRLDLQRYRRFVEPMLLDTLAYYWVPRVDAGQRDRYESTARHEGLADFRIHDLEGASPARDYYLPLFYGAARRDSALPIGLDMRALPERQALLNKAEAERQVTVSGLVRVYGMPDNIHEGVLLAAPVLGRAEEPLPGFVVAIVSLRQELEDGLPSEMLANLPTRLDDVTDPARPQRLYQSHSVADDSELVLERTLAFGDRTYRLEVRPSPAFLADNRTTSWHLVLGTGIALSLMLGGYVLLLISQRQRALRLVAERTAELRQRELQLKLSEERWSFALDGAGHGVWDWEPDSGRMFFSPAWKTMLGYLPGELEDSLDTALGLRHPDDLQGSREALRRYLNGEVDVYRSEHRMRRKDGSWAWVLERGQVVEINDDGSPLRLIGTQTDISESKAVELQLALANGNLRSLLDAATEVSIIATDLEGYILQYNAGAERMFGYSAEEMLGTRPRTLHLESEVRERCAALAQRLGRPVPDFHRYVVEVTAGRCYDEHEWTYVRKDGSQLIGNLILTEVRNEAGELIGFLGISTDITERKRVQQALEERDRLLEKLSARVPGAIYQYQLMPDGSSRFPYVSAGIHDLVEMNAPEVRQDGERVFQRVHPEDLERVQGSILASAQTLETWREDFRVLLPQKGVRWLRGESVPERMPDGSVLWHGYISDITGHKLVEQELRTLSITDALTGVYNRRHFQERLEVEIARAQRSEGPLSVLMFDIDHFKQVNDRFGHEAGDRVLKAICQRVGERLRRIDVFCRLGGEEFIVICPNTGESQVQVLADALWNTLSKEALPEVGVVTASFGLAGWREGELADDLLRRVDEAVYAAKQAGRNRVCVAA